jgi:hypothetical protein
MVAVACGTSLGAAAQSIESRVSVDVEAAGGAEDSRYSPGRVAVCKGAGCSTSGLPLNTASASASTDFGANRASIYANSDGPLILAGATALSFWQDEWSFSGVQPGAGVTLRFRLDGSWHDMHTVDYQFGIFDPTLPFRLGPEDKAPFEEYGHPIKMDEVGAAGFNGVAGAAAGSNGLVFSPPSGDLEEGAIDWSFEVVFQPVNGRIYTLASALYLAAEVTDFVPGQIGSDPTPFGTSARAEFGSTAALTEVLLPAGARVISASQAQYAVTTVPEPSSWALLLGGLGLLAASVRRRQAGG